MANTNSQKERVDNILVLKENFQKTSYASDSFNNTYQKALLTDIETDYITDYKYYYWNNHNPAAQGLCLFNFEGGD